MKCPGCKYVCSDLRDLCPKCYLDLRPAKKALGIAVTKPDDSYEDLLEIAFQRKPRKKKNKKNPKEDAPKGFFASLFGKKSAGSTKKKRKQSPTSDASPEQISEPLESSESFEPGSPSIQEHAIPFEETPASEVSASIRVEESLTPEEIVHEQEISGSEDDSEFPEDLLEGLTGEEPPQEDSVVFEPSSEEATSTNRFFSELENTLDQVLEEIEVNESSEETAQVTFEADSQIDEDDSTESAKSPVEGFLESLSDRPNETDHEGDISVALSAEDPPEDIPQSELMETEDEQVESLEEYSSSDQDPPSTEIPEPLQSEPREESLSAFTASEDAGLPVQEKQGSEVPEPEPSSEEASPFSAQATSVAAHETPKEETDWDEELVETSSDALNEYESDDSEFDEEDIYSSDGDNENSFLAFSSNDEKSEVSSENFTDDEDLVDQNTENQGEEVFEQETDQNASELSQELPSASENNEPFPLAYRDYHVAQSSTEEPIEEPEDSSEQVDQNERTTSSFQRFIDSVLESNDPENLIEPSDSESQESDKQPFPEVSDPKSWIDSQEEQALSPDRKGQEEEEHSLEPESEEHVSVEEEEEEYEALQGSTEQHNIESSSRSGWSLSSWLKGSPPKEMKDDFLEPDQTEKENEAPKFVSHDVQVDEETETLEASNSTESVAELEQAPCAQDDEQEQAKFEYIADQEAQETTEFESMEGSAEEEDGAPYEDLQSPEDSSARDQESLESIGDDFAHEPPESGETAFNPPMGKSLEELLQGFDSPSSQESELSSLVEESLSPPAGEDLPPEHNVDGIEETTIVETESEDLQQDFLDSNREDVDQSPNETEQAILAGLSASGSEYSDSSATMNATTGAPTSIADESPRYLEHEEPSEEDSLKHTEYQEARGSSYAEYDPSYFEPESLSESEEIEQDNSEDEGEPEATPTSVPDELPSLNSIGSTSVSGGSYVSHDSEELMALFLAAEQDLSDLSDDFEFEMGGEFFQNFSDREDLKLLFSLADETLINPHALDEYQEIRHSDETKLGSQELQESLEYVEKRAQENFVDLHASTDRSENIHVVTLRADSPVRPRYAKIASVPRLLFGFLFDLVGFVVCVAVSFAMYLQFTDVGLASQLLLNPAMLNAYDLVSVVTLFLQCSIIWLLIFPVLSYLTFGGSLGLSLVGLTLIQMNGHKARLPHIVVRSCCWPISLLTFGWLPSLVGKRSLHDVLAETAVTFPHNQELEDELSDAADE